MGHTTIGWCDHAINPIRARHRATGRVGHYCEKVSLGCRGCYASARQVRFGLPPFEKPFADQVEVFFDETKLDEVLRRRIPTRYFWCDMTDMFGAWVPDAWIDQMFAVMALTPHHTHLVLTKRPERMSAYLQGQDEGKDVMERLTTTVLERDPEAPSRLAHHGFDIYRDDEGKIDDVGVWWPLPHVWLGTSAEDQTTLEARLPWLLRTPAAVRFVSVEPLLGPLDLRLEDCWLAEDSSTLAERLQWVIIGGESGRVHRPMELAWLTTIVEQCRVAGVPVFVKQDSGRLPGQQGRIPAAYWVQEFPQGLQAGPVATASRHTQASPTAPG